MVVHTCKPRAQEAGTERRTLSSRPSWAIQQELVSQKETTKHQTKIIIITTKMMTSAWSRVSSEARGQLWTDPVSSFGAPVIVKKAGQGSDLRQINA